jgi:hypothetical protein
MLEKGDANRLHQQIETISLNMYETGFEGFQWN